MITYVKDLKPEAWCGDFYWLLEWLGTSVIDQYSRL